MVIGGNVFEPTIEEQIEQLIMILENAGEEYQIAVELAHQLKEEIDQLADE